MGYAHTPEMQTALLLLIGGDEELGRLIDMSPPGITMWEALKNMVADIITTVADAEKRAFSIKANINLQSQVGFELVNHIGECYDRVRESDKQNITHSMAAAIVNAVQEY